MKEGKERSIFKTFFYNLFIRCGHYIICIIIIVTMFLFMAYNRRIYKEDFLTFENKMQEKLDMQTEYIGGLFLRLEEGNEAVLRGIDNTNIRIQRVNAVYEGILTEMQKKTLEAVYTENVLIDMENEAYDLFKKGKYALASDQYASLAKAQPENIEARFFNLYSLFLNNKLDRNNYSRIKEGMKALEKNGYIRVEIKEALDYIDLEENGLPAGVIQ